MKPPLRVLMVEDSADDARLMLRELTRGGFKVTHAIVTTAAEMRAALEQQRWDVILCDYALPHFSGGAALSLARELSLDGPFIFVSGSMGEDIAVEAMKSGAQDYVMKDNLARLVPAIQRELRDAQTRRDARRAEEKLRESERNYRSVVAAMAEGLCFQEADGKVIALNPAAQSIQGCSLVEMSDDISDDLMRDAVHEDGSPFPRETQPAMVTLRTGVPQSNVIMGIRRPTGERRWISINSQPLIAAEGEKPYAVVSTFHDITEGKRAKESLENVLCHAHAMVMQSDVTAPEGWDQHALEWGAENYHWESRFESERAAQAVLSIALQPGESYHHGWNRAKHSEDLRPMNLVAARAFTSGADRWEQEFRAIDREGRLHWFAQTASVEPVARGRWRVTTINTDITARKQAEQHIRQLNRTYAVLSDINQLIVRERDPQSVLNGACRIVVEQGGFTLAWIGLVDASSGQLKLAAHAGAAPDALEMLNRTLGDLRHNCPFTAQVIESGDHVVCNDIEHDPQAAHCRETALPRGYRSMVSFPLTVGERRVGAFNLYADEAGFFDKDELRLLDELARDISFAIEGGEHERERQAAVARIRQLAAFPELNPNPVLEFTADGTLNYCNQAALDLSASLGLPEISRLLPPGTREIVRACLATNQPRLRLETMHGPRTLSWSFYPIGEVHAVHCYVGEITDRLRLEEQFRQSQKLEAIGQLAGGVAHDFNNILAVIMMQAQMTTQCENVPEEVREGLQQIFASSERAASLTRQLLLFSRRQVMQPRDLDLNEVVTSLAKMLQRIIGEDVRLQLNLNSTTLMTHADDGMLDQVLLNLAVNARDAMPQGGRLIVETSERLVDEEVARLCPEARPGRFVCLSVSDNGVGIPPEVLPHIFDPFFTTKEPGKGTGLGLATVFGIIKQHQGWIKVYSEPGQGANFQIFLPASAASVTSTAGAAGPKPRGGTETILLVEDELPVRNITRAFLEQNGYRILEAANGVEALKIWAEARDSVALLLTDLVMPGGISGQQLARRLQAERPQLKVIFTTGYSAEIAGRKIQLRPGENFLQKPVPTNQLLETVRRSLDG